MKKRKTHIKDLGRYLAERRGQFNDDTNVIVMDNVISRDHEGRLKVKSTLANKSEIWEGEHTVALFKITKRHAVNMTPQ